MMPSEMLDNGTKYVTYEALIGPMRFINLINIELPLIIPEN